MGTYSFQDVGASIIGPFISLSIGAGAGSAEEGIDIEPTGDKSSMTEGADGNGQHNLHASRSGRLTFRFLKTSPTNARLLDAYNLQTTSAAFHGQNTIVVRNPVSGDQTTALKCAFVKRPKIAYAKDGPTIEWMFDCIVITGNLGTGGPAF